MKRAVCLLLRGPVGFASADAGAECLCTHRPEAGVRPVRPERRWAHLGAGARHSDETAGLLAERQGDPPHDR